MCVFFVFQGAGQSHPRRKTTSAVHEHWAWFFLECAPFAALQKKEEKKRLGVE